MAIPPAASRKSDSASVPPGRSTRAASRKNALRDGKWNTHSTASTWSSDDGATGRTHPSAATSGGAGPSRRCAQRSWRSSMLSPASRQPRLRAAMWASVPPNPQPTSSTARPSATPAAATTASVRAVAALT